MRLPEIVDATALKWSAVEVPAGTRYPDEPTEEIPPGVYVHGVDPDDDPENGPAVQLSVSAVVGGAGPEAGIDRSKAFADQLVLLLQSMGEPS